MMSFLVNWNPFSISAAQLTFMRGFLDSVILLPFILPSLPQLKVKRSWLIWLRSFAGSISLALFYWNLQRSAVGTATLLSNLAPVFVVMLSRVFLRERLRLREFVALGIIFASVLLLQIPNVELTGLTGATLSLGLTGAFFAGLAYFSLKLSTSSFPALLIIFCFCLTNMPVALLMPSEPWLWPNATQFLFMIAVALSALGGQIFMTFTYMKLRASVASVLIMTTLGWAVFFSAFFTGRIPSVFECVAYALLIFGVYLLNRTTRARMGSDGSKAQIAAQPLIEG